MVTYHGRWRVTVVAKDSGWDQRVAITGASTGGGAMPGVVGETRVVDGEEWSLTIEHNDGSGWLENEGVLPDPMLEIGANLRQVVRTKDHYFPGDNDPNDLVIQVEKIGPMFEVTVRPYAVDGPTLLMMADGVFVGINGLQYMGVEIKNTWGKAYDGQMALDVSDLGRATLASFGVTVLDTWSQTSLTATQQTVVGRRVRIPALGISEATTVYFQVDASASRKGKPRVEFVLMDLGGTPDPTNSMRHNSRTVFIAEVGFDRNTGTAVAHTPEGKLTLKLKSMAVDLQAIDNACKRLRRDLQRAGTGSQSLEDDLRRLLARARGDYCDQRMLRQMMLLICRCLRGCRDCSDDGPGRDGGRHGWDRVCLPGAIWLPLEFDYGVEIDGGFKGKYGPLAFQDPWWKIVLAVIAAIAWCAGVIETIVAEKTGWGNEGDLPKKIGTVGASDRNTTDACIIELDGSRPAVQDVADAITGETNNSPISALGTVIPIDPEVACPSLAPVDVVGMHVYKSGARTGLTHGIISSIGTFTQNRDEGHTDLTLPNQFIIGADSAFGEELFDDHGDSGSIVLSRETDTMNQVVGLVHSLSGGTSPIQDVLSALNLRLR